MSSHATEQTRQDRTAGRARSRANCSIGDYAAIGDCRSAALVSRDGSIDWLCWPCFDSPAVFASLLDPENGGFWQICPTEPFTVRRQYLDGTNILETIFQTSTGILRLVDLMPVAEEEYKRRHLFPNHQILRVIEGLAGRVDFEVHFAPRPHFAEQQFKLSAKGALGLRVEIGNALLALHSPLQYALDAEGAHAKGTVHAGETVACSLSYTSEAPAVLPELDRSRDVLKRSEEWWKTWSVRCTYVGPYRDAVLRSVLVLKLLEFAPSGAFVAALTTSLPERVGGDLNFDYRYCWLRDASLTIHALCGTGFDEEAEAFGEWMLHATRLTQPKLMVMYDVYGRLAKPEQELKHLSGYLQSAPVRIGNEARKQIQMDTYGEVICGISRLFKSKKPMDRGSARVLIGFGKHVCKNWRNPDAGIWEPRGAPTVHTHSLLLCWVALDELIQMAERGVLGKTPIDRFSETREQIRQHIETTAWSEELQSYTSGPGVESPDATLLLMALHNFEKPLSSRLQGTYRRIKQKLGAGGPLLYRYRNQDLPEEGAFGICGFWAAEFLAMGGGTLEEAEETFEALLAYANDVGLFAEEIDPKTGAALGNFPQAFTHVGLITAALAIEKRRADKDKAQAPAEACATEEQI